MRPLAQHGFRGGSVDENDEAESSTSAGQRVHFNERLFDRAKFLKVGLNISRRRVLRKTAEEQLPRFRRRRPA